MQTLQIFFTSHSIQNRNSLGYLVVVIFLTLMLTMVMNQSYHDTNDLAADKSVVTTIAQ